MDKNALKHLLKRYYITDTNLKIPMLTQVKKAVLGGASMILYKNDEFKPDNIDEVYKISHFCRLNKTPLIINSEILLAKAVNADGVHLTHIDNPETAKNILGKDKIVGITISNRDEFQSSDFSFADYIGIDPIFFNDTKPDTKKNLIQNFLEEIRPNTNLPVVVLEEMVNKNREQKIVQTRWNDEFKLIEKLKTLKSFHTGLKVKAGDDAALLNSLNRPIISTDTQREDVHFKLSWQSFYEIGYKAVSISLSDLAASFAKPESVFINLGLPPYLSNDDIFEIYSGINDNLVTYNVSIGGGNISKAEKLSIDLFVIGDGKKIFPKRSNGVKGQLVCSTGNLGLSKAGLEILANNIKGYEKLIKRFKFPKPRFDAAKILKDFKIDCVTDISDGLYGDIGHIAKESGLTAKITPKTFMIDEELEAYCNFFKKDPKEYIISGGEDYQLLFTCHINLFRKIKKEIPSAFVAGELKEFSGDFVESDISCSSFDHGK